MATVTVRFDYARGSVSTGIVGEELRRIATEMNSSNSFTTHDRVFDVTDANSERTTLVSLTDYDIRVDESGQGFDPHLVDIVIEMSGHVAEGVAVEAAKQTLMYIWKHHVMPTLIRRRGADSLGGQGVVPDDDSDSRNGEE